MFCRIFANISCSDKITSSYLQSNDTLASLDLLLIKLSSCFVCVFHTDVDLCVHPFGLCLRQKAHVKTLLNVTKACAVCTRFLTMLASASSEVWT